MTTEKLPTSETDVLIIGAGPSGLMTAQALARLGVKTRLIDRRAKGAIYGNADGLQPRTLEVFESYGFIDQTLARSARLNTLVIYKTSESGIVRLPPEVNIQVKTRYPFEATCSIRTIEGVMARSASEAGLEIEYELQPFEASLSRDPEVLKDSKAYAVRVTIESAPDSESGESHPKEIINAKYLIGADGANSWVRRNFQVPMEGEKTEYTWGVVEGIFDTDFPDHRCKAIIQSPLGSVIASSSPSLKLRRSNFKSSFPTESSSHVKIILPEFTSNYPKMIFYERPMRELTRLTLQN